MTENHEYKTPSQGAQDWHIPLNENFRRLDTDVEIRDTEANRNQYTPKDGAKFLATDTGTTYIGDGSVWQQLPSSRGAMATASYIVAKDGTETVGIDGRSGTEEFRGTAAGDVIHNVLNTMPDGGSIYFQPATYEIARQLTIGADGAALRSDWGVLEFQDHDTNPGGTQNPPVQKDLVCEADLSWVRLDGLVLDGNKANRTTATSTLDVSGVKRVSVTDCVIRGGKSVNQDWGYGLVGGLDNSDERLVIDGCLFEDADRHAIHQGARITNCTFVNNATIGHGGVIATGAFERSIVANNHFIDNGDAAIGMFGGSVLQVTGNFFDDSVAHGKQTGQVFVDQAGFDRVEISNNVFRLPSTTSGEDEAVAHVLVAGDDASGTCTITGNQFVGGDPAIAATSWGGAIERLLVTDNVVEDSPTLLTVSGANTITVQDNIFDGNGAVDLAAEVTRGVVADNTLYEASITDNTGSDVIVESNYSV